VPKLVASLEDSLDGAHHAAVAITTTDLVSKSAALEVCLTRAADSTLHHWPQNPSSHWHRWTHPVAVPMHAALHDMVPRVGFGMLVGKQLLCVCRCSSQGLQAPPTPWSRIGNLLQSRSLFQSAVCPCDS